MTSESCLMFSQLMFDFTALVGSGPSGDVRECQKSTEQGQRKHPHRPTNLDHSRQAGGGKWKHTHGGEDY